MREGVIASEQLIIYPACHPRHYLVFIVLFLKKDVFRLNAKIDDENVLLLCCFIDQH